MKKTMERLLDAFLSTSFMAVVETILFLVVIALIYIAVGEKMVLTPDMVWTAIKVGISCEIIRMIVHGIERKISNR